MTFSLIGRSKQQVRPLLSSWSFERATPKLAQSSVARKPLTCSQGQRRSCQYHRSRKCVILKALNSKRLPDGTASGLGWIPHLSIAPGALSLLSLALHGTSEAACIHANAIATLGAAIFFLLYFCTSLGGAGQRWVAQLAAALRPAQDGLLRGCALAAAVQVCVAACLCVTHPQHAEGALVPLYVAGYISVGVLAASQQRRKLRGRVRMEIEEGEGERHSVMAQGTRLAARNYAWLILAVHLATQTTAGIASLIVGGGSGSPSSAPFVVAYGALALMYGIAGAFKFLPSLQSRV